MIRWLVVLLLLANVLFGALIQWEGGGRNDDAQLVNLQMNAQQIRIVAGGQEPARPAAASTPAAACLAWGPFEETEAKRALDALDDIVPAERIETREIAAVARYWVHMPVQRSRADAQKKLGELKALGIAEASIVDGDAQWANAIDLGLFNDEAKAREHLARLQLAGVRTALVTERKAGGGMQYLVREPSEVVTTRVLERKQKDFPDSALGAMPCPQPGPGARQRG